MKLIDLDEIDLDDDGELSGLDDQITKIKEDFPGWFFSRRRRRSGDGTGSASGNTGAGGANKKPDKDDKPKTWKETLAERMGNG